MRFNKLGKRRKITMKKIIKWIKWPFIMGVFILIGMLIALGIAETFHKIGNDKFCGGCHVMEPMVQTWKKSVHGGNNKAGVAAECSACHTDYSSATSYTYVKVVSGIKDVISYKFNTPDAEYFLNEINDPSHYVFDSGCLKCHKKIAESPVVPDNTRNIHKAYFENQDNEYMRCTSCHRSEIAHPGLDELLKKGFSQEESGEKPKE